MKRILLLSAFVLCSFSSMFAATITVKVKNFAFSPKTVNAVVGDVIMFKWVNGIHNTTSTSVPVGSSSWAALIDSAHKNFSYTITKIGVYSFVCTIHAPGMKGTINVTAALPAGLTDVSAKLSDKAKAVINWKTKTETDIAYYSIQRSTDADNFKEIARVRPSLNSSGSQSHSYVDENADNAARYVYYQVKMVDAKGNYQLSDIKMIAQPAAINKLIVSLSPNPISKPGHLMVQFNADKEGKMLMQLYNSNGKIVNQMQMTADIGLNNGHFHLGDIPPGNYYVVCTLGNLKEKHAIIVK
jgi:plastocyanin